MRWGESPLDKLSNRALDAIEAKQYVEAAKLCRRLLQRYPEALDGHERTAMLREAQGRFAEAVAHYDQMLAMLRDQPQGTDEETLREITRMRNAALQQANP